MSLSAQKLRGVINLLADPMQAASAAGILAKEAKERGVLVADLIAQATVPTPTPSAPRAPDPGAAAPPAAPTWRDVEPIDDGGPYVRRIDFEHVGLVAEIIHETDKAWLMETPSGGEAWLAKSQCQHHGEDPNGRAILVVPRWLARKIGVTP